MDELYAKYIAAREKANQIQDELMKQGLNKDEIFNHPDWLAATEAEHAAYAAHLES